MRRSFALAAFVSLVFSGASAQVNKAKLDSLFDILASHDKAMGSLAIAKNGEFLYSRSVGYASIGDNGKMPANVQTKYRVGSVTKMFTAVMVFQLIEQDKLSLATTLDKYYPGIPNAGRITIAHLLGHRSGIHNFTDDADYTSWLSKPRTQEEMVKIIAAAKPDFEPGSAASYSNSNYVLLGYIIEKITGKSYAENLDERIVSKLGLANTAVGGRIDAKKNESLSYHYSAGWQPLPETDMSIPGGAGSIISTAADLVKFTEALFTGKLVSAKSLSEMKNIRDGYGLGLFQFPFNEKKAFGHTGGIDGFSSMVGYFPGDSLAVAYTSNGQVYPVNDILIGVLGIYFNLPYRLPSFAKTDVSASELDQFTGVYASDQIPLKITVMRQGTVLMAQATGQSAFPLESIGKNKFQFTAAGIEMEFDPGNNRFILQQGGGSFVFTREKK